MLLVCVVGIYSVKANSVEIFIMAAFGLLGYVLRKLEFDCAPLLLAVVLGDRIEVSFRRALIITDGNYWALAQSAVSKVFIGAIVLLVALQALAWLLGFRQKLMDNTEAAGIKAD